MTLHALAGKPVPASLIIDIDKLTSDYYGLKPDPSDVRQRVSFGTSGHRGSSSDLRFNEAHILAITQAICDYRSEHGIKGPLFVGMDTHALSVPAHETTLEVLAANKVETRYQERNGFTPTPVISNAIIRHNLGQTGLLADGIVITPSHNPPSDGGFKYNPPNGGPAGSDVTGWIEERGNTYLESGLAGIKRIPIKKALLQPEIQAIDFSKNYIDGLSDVIDFDAIKYAGLKIGADPLGGAGTFYWSKIAEQYSFPLEIINERVDPTFSFMRVDWDGKVRMDCSSPYAMAGLVEMKDRFDIAFGNDPDFDRHGIVTSTGGLLAPNHYLAVCVDYLFSSRSLWSEAAAIGKTLVSSSMIDRVALSIGRTVYEVPVGFKWFVEGLSNGSLGFGGEESAGASFLTRKGQPWSTDKDGFILNLLAAEMTAITEKNPSERYQELTAIHGSPSYKRIDAAATRDQKAVLSSMSGDQVKTSSLAGEGITAKLTNASGNGASIGGLKVTTENGWFAARPSGTEDIYKVYAESFIGDTHLSMILEEAQAVVSSVFEEAGL